MQSNFWAGTKYLGQHKTFWDLKKDRALEKAISVLKSACGHCSVVGGPVRIEFYFGFFRLAKSKQF